MMPYRLSIALLSMTALLGACSRPDQRTESSDSQNASVAKDVDSTLQDTETHGEGASRPLTAPPPGNAR